MSKLGKLNFYVLQWFFIRLAKVSVEGNTVGWTVLKGVVPLTGWKSDYRYLPGCKPLPKR
jgi:hypothetical protein